MLRTLVVLLVVVITAPAYGHPSTNARGALSAVEGQQLADEPTRREALQHYREGQEFLSSEQFEKAVDSFQRAIDRDPLLALAHYGLGQSYMALRRYASAVAGFRGARDAYKRLSALAHSESVNVDRQRQEEIRELRAACRAAGSRRRAPTAATPSSSSRTAFATSNVRSSGTSMCRRCRRRSRWPWAARTSGMATWKPPSGSGRRPWR
jgi:hypothetical protein